MKIIPISSTIAIGYGIKGTPPFEFDEKSMENETWIWSKFLNGEKAMAEKMLVSEEGNICQKAGLWVSQSGIWEGTLTIWVRSFEIVIKIIKLITEFTKSICVTRIG